MSIATVLEQASAIPPGRVIIGKCVTDLMEQGFTAAQAQALCREAVTL
jgi:hypothetical protein